MAGPWGASQGACRCNIFVAGRVLQRASRGLSGRPSGKTLSSACHTCRGLPASGRWGPHSRCVSAAFVLPEGRRRIALPYLPASISFRGVELAFNTVRDPSATRPGVRAAFTRISRGRAPNRRPSKYAQAWAYSSIGQSPRLITGLFLVRTQVGPLTPSSWRTQLVREEPF